MVILRAERHGTVGSLWPCTKRDENVNFVPLPPGERGLKMTHFGRLGPFDMSGGGVGRGLHNDLRGGQSISKEEIIIIMIKKT